MYDKNCDFFQRRECLGYNTCIVAKRAMVAVLIKESLHITTKLKYGNRIQYLGHSSILLRNLRLCSILPTIQAKVALVLKYECFLITYITDYPALSLPPIS